MKFPTQAKAAVRSVASALLVVAILAGAIYLVLQ